MSIIANMDMEILLEPEEVYVQTNNNLTNASTITINNLGNLEQSPIFTIEVPNALTNLTITNITTGISATIPTTTISAGVSLLVYNDAIYKNNLSTTISATYTGIFNLRENASNVISFNLVPSDTTSINVDTTWLKPNGNAVLQCFAEGFSISKNKSQQRKKTNILNHYTNGYINNDIDYDFSIDRLFYNDEFFNETDDDQTYRITYQTNSAVGAIQHQIYFLSGCHFNSYSINQSSTQQTDSVKEGIRGKGCKLFKG